METAKMQRLLLALEGLALITAALLILIDYKLKNDLVVLFGKLEGALEDGRKLFGPEFGSGVDIAGVRAGHLASVPAPVEASTANGAAAQVGSNGKRPGSATKRPTAKRPGRDGSAPVPGPDNTVGS